MFHVIFRIYLYSPPHSKNNTLSNTKGTLGNTKGVYKITSKFLTKKETMILEVLFARTDEGPKWISLDTLRKDAKEKHELNSHEVDVALKNLISNKYLRLGVSLSL